MQSLEAISDETLEKTAYSHYVCEQREDTAVEHQRQIVQRLMAKLPESERTVMVLYYLGEMTCEEISKFLGVSPNTIKSRLQRARERL
jgi:RNA polymerase sigma factor (sigma-70 family)